MTIRSPRTFNQWLDEQMTDPDFAAEFERVGEEIHLGSQVRAIRIGLGMTQAELARKAGTSQSAIARLELGQIEPRIHTLRRVGDALGARLLVELQPGTAA